MAPTKIQAKTRCDMQQLRMSKRESTGSAKSLLVDGLAN